MENTLNEELVAQLTNLRDGLKQLKANIQELIPLTEHMSEYRTYRAHVIAQNVATAQYTMQMIKRGKALALRHK